MMLPGKAILRVCCRPFVGLKTADGFEVSTAPLLAYSPFDATLRFYVRSLAYHLHVCRLSYDYLQCVARHVLQFSIERMLLIPETFYRGSHLVPRLSCMQTFIDLNIPGLRKGTSRLSSFDVQVDWAMAVKCMKGNSNAVG